MRRTVALLESPAQILNLLERVFGVDTRSGGGSGVPAGGVSAPGPSEGMLKSGPVGGPLDSTLSGGSDKSVTVDPLPIDPTDLALAVIQPRAVAARRQLLAMAELARAEGLAVEVFAPRAGVWGLGRSGAVLSAWVARARTLILGDPFSQLAQLLLPFSRAREVIVIDDGTATMEFAAQLAEGRPLVRWHSTESVPSRARRATALLTPGPKRRLEVFSSLPLPDLPGAAMTVNGYRWAKARFGPPEVTDTVDLLGTSLVETGVVSARAYLDQVARLVESHGVSRYLAHRRESPDKLAALTERCGVHVVHPELPLELHARNGPVARTVISFPSTMVHTLPLLLDGTGVRVVIQEVVDSWITDSASDRASVFLAEVTGSARDRHGLATVPPAGHDIYTEEAGQ